MVGALVGFHSVSTGAKKGADVVEDAGHVPVLALRGIGDAHKDVDVAILPWPPLIWLRRLQQPAQCKAACHDAVTIIRLGYDACLNKFREMMIKTNG